MDLTELWYEVLLVFFLGLLFIRIRLGFETRKKVQLEPEFVPQTNVPQTPALESERYRLRNRLREFDESILSVEKEIEGLTMAVVEDSVEARQLHWLKIDERNATLDRLRKHRKMAKEILGRISA